jgi:CheY-like chemotaxis protein
VLQDRRGSALERERHLDVVIVEDDEDSAVTLADLLSLSGNRVVTAVTGQAGVREVAARHPDVLICDVGLPDMSGLEVIRRIRASEGGGRVFAMALTGYAHPRDREEALAAGFDAHLPKPPPLEELERMLAAAARKTS